VVGVEDTDEGDMFFKELDVGESRGQVGPGGRVKGGRLGGCGPFAMHCPITRDKVLLFAVRF
jgi:hypothetical protein